MIVNRRGTGRQPSSSSKKKFIYTSVLVVPNNIELDLLFLAVYSETGDESSTSKCRDHIKLPKFLTKELLNYGQ